MIMEETINMLMLFYAGFAAVIIGLLMILADLIILIIRAVKKKSVKVPAILIGVGLVLAIAGVFTYVMVVVSLSDGASPDIDYTDKIEMAETAEDGSISYRIADFSVIDDNGNTFDNSTLAEYKYTVINYWEPWCGPCKGELPDLEKLYEDYKDRGINMVGLYSDADGAEDVIMKNGLTYATVCIGDGTDSDAFSLFDAPAIPSTIILDSEGRLVQLDLPESEITAYIDTDAAEELRTLYNGIAIGARSYKFWAEKLDALLS